MSSTNPTPSKQQSQSRLKSSEAQSLALALDCGILTENHQLQELVHYTVCAAKNSPRQTVFLISGPTGTGKELFARLIHSATSPNTVFVPLNCAAVPKELIEAELFGSLRGAYTGAIKDKLGYFLTANGGTLLLDEIGDMPFELQSRLLRAIETRKITSLGSTNEVDIDVRIVCATNRNLPQLVADGKFRSDLYYRLNTIEVRLPALSERPEDIPLLAKHFWNKTKNSDLDLTPNILADLLKYPWPGNVRELERTIQRAAILSDQNTLDTKFIPTNSTNHSSLHEFVRNRVNSVLAACQGNRQLAAKLLEISEALLEELTKDDSRYNPSHQSDQ